ncbi:hypothetical protein GCM10027027_08490 [Neomicrococcus lactis]
MDKSARPYCVNTRTAVSTTVSRVKAMESRLGDTQWAHETQRGAEGEAGGIIRVLYA